MPHLPGVSHRRRASLTSAYSLFSGCTAFLQKTFLGCIKADTSACGHTGSRGSSIDETRGHHGEETTAQDETVMDSEQGNSMSPGTKDNTRALEEPTNMALQCSCILYHNCDQAPT